MTDTLTPSAAAVQSVPTPGRITFEEFLEWCNGDRRAEWVDGEVVLLSPNSLAHQDLAAFLYELIVAFVRAGNLGRVYFAPILMRLATRPSGREPDLVFVSAEHADRLRETYIDGPADLAVEIVSPESVVRDRGDKFVEYEAAGVPEYWLIDPLRREARFHQRGEDGHYHAATIDSEGFYYSAVLPGFRLRVDWLWQRPLPAAPDVLEQTRA